MVWENVPGAFSSNGGADFKAVLEETIRVAEPDAPDIPLPAKGKWPLADAWYGDGWSVAYRVLDAQFWGVPQRRRRIALVADFGGLAAPEILFIRQSVQGDIDEGRAAGEETAGGAGDGLNCTVTAFHLTQDPITSAEISPCLSSGNPVRGQASVGIVQAAGFDGTMGAKARGIGYEVEVSPTLNAEKQVHVYDARGNGDGQTVCTITGDHENRVTDYTALCIGNGQANQSVGEQAGALNCMHDQQAVFVPEVARSLRANAAPRYREDGDTYPVQAGTVRRFTPLECERLQGYPDGWTDIGEWTDTKGKKRETSDAARYKALGNSIALPPWAWVLKRIAACYERPATLASLFDGIGGFPLIWERLNGPGTALWASEIEEFPIAVTKTHFGDYTISQVQNTSQTNEEATT